jgi:hypothetical protein
VNIAGIAAPRFFFMPKTTKKKGRRPMNRQNSGASDDRSGVSRRDTSMSGTWNVLAESDPSYTRIQRFDNKVYRIQQTVNYGNVVSTNTSTPTGYGKYFTLADLNQVSSLTGVFDQYRIDEIFIKFMPQLQSSAAYGGSQVVTALDYDDAATPGSQASILQYSNAMITEQTSAHWRHLTPHIAVAAYSGTFASFKNERASWIDSNSTGVQHYGFKAYLDSSTSSLNWFLYATFRISFRNVF